MTKVLGKLESDCTDEEKLMIEAFFKNAHPSNHPKDRNKARWSFYKGSAGLYSGFII